MPASRRSPGANGAHPRGPDSRSVRQLVVLGADELAVCRARYEAAARFRWLSGATRPSLRPKFRRSGRAVSNPTSQGSLCYGSIVPLDWKGSARQVGRRWPGRECRGPAPAVALPKGPLEGAMATAVRAGAGLVGAADERAPVLVAQQDALAAGQVQVGHHRQRGQQRRPDKPGRARAKSPANASNRQRHVPVAPRRLLLAWLNRSLQLPDHSFSGRVDNPKDGMPGLLGNEGL